MLRLGRRQRRIVPAETQSVECLVGIICAMPLKREKPAELCVFLMCTRAKWHTSGNLEKRGSTSLGRSFVFYLYYFKA